MAIEIAKELEKIRKNKELAEKFCDRTYEKNMAFLKEMQESGILKKPKYDLAMPGAIINRSPQF